MSIKNNTTSLQNLLEMAKALPEAGSGGVELPTLTNEGTASDLLAGKQLIDGNGNVVTGTITTQSAKTITPTKSSQVAVEKDRYTTGVITVGAIPSEYVITNDATASADKIMSGETAYVNGSKVTGTFSIDSELTAQDDLITHIQSTVDNLPNVGMSIETCIGTVYVQHIDLGADMILYYLDKNLTLQFIDFFNGFNGDVISFEVVKNSIIYSNYSFVNEDGNIHQINEGDNHNIRAAYVLDDFTITVY